MRNLSVLFFVLCYSCTVYVSAQCPVPTIAGHIKYDNIQETPLRSSRVYLKSLSNLVIDSCQADQNGYFSFCSVPIGSYKLSAKTNMSWGGVNSVDALLALNHMVGISNLSGLRATVADVNGSSLINSIDALLMAQRFVQIICTFPIGDWVFEEPELTVSNTNMQYIAIKGLCAGDVNGSYHPYAQSFNCGDTITDSRDNQQYPTVQIGTQCWMQSNLNIGIMVTSTYDTNIHSDCENNCIIEKYCYNNIPANCLTYGGLYDWDEMMQYEYEPGNRGICPDGWHIPAFSDYHTLLTFIGLQDWCGKMKDTGLAFWMAPNTGATNSSGFTGLGSGHRGYIDSEFSNIQEETMFWTSTKAFFSPLQWPQFVHLKYNQSYLSPLVATAPESGFSVRCIKD